MNKFPSIFASKQIYIRGLEKEDLSLRTIWFNDDEIIGELLMDPPISLASTFEWFERSTKDKSKINFSICDLLTHEVIGMTGLINMDKEHSMAQFYITIGDKKYWGKRIADEVIGLVLNYGFQYQNLNKIYLWTIFSNSRARKVYERNGFLKEGIMREHYYCKGKFQDIIQQSILKKDYLKS